MTAPAVTADVADAIGELRTHFGAGVDAEPDGTGGAIVTVGGVKLADGWGRASAPVRFVVPYNYPATPPYPYYMPRECQPPGPWPQALQPVDWRGEAMIQVSLRNTNWDPARDTVVGCVLQVAAWLRGL